jgi:hypothetical protein
MCFTSLNAQNEDFDEKLDPSLKHIYDSISAVFDEVEKEFPTWKTGDDNSALVGLFKNIITDPIAKHLFSIDPSVSQLHITGFNTIHNGVNLNTWLASLDPSLYPSDEFTIKYNGDEEIEHLSIYNSKNEVVRKIMIVWDKTFDGKNYTNLRSIIDSYFNQE